MYIKIAIVHPKIKGTNSDLKLLISERIIDPQPKKTKLNVPVNSDIKDCFEVVNLILFSNKILFHILK